MTPPRITRLGGYGSTLRWAIKMALLAAAVTNCFLHHYLNYIPRVRTGIKQRNGVQVWDLNSVSAVRTRLELATPGVTGRYSKPTELPHQFRLGLQRYNYFLFLQIFCGFFSEFPEGASPAKRPGWNRRRIRSIHRQDGDQHRHGDERDPDSFLRADHSHKDSFFFISK